jgi:hypothetical protein
VRGVDWILGYSLALEQLESGRGPRNPFPPGTQEHAGYEEAVSDLITTIEE